MKKLEMNQMSNLQGGGRGCFAAMSAFGASMGGLHAAKTDVEIATASLAVTSAFATMVNACEE